MPTSFIMRVGEGLYELRLQGRFAHPHWVVVLFAGLAESQVSVAAGRASQAANQEWEARFTLDFRNSTAVAETLDYVALAQRKPTLPDMTLPRLSRFEILRRPAGLEVVLEGADQLGFLSRLLGRVSLLALFPTEIEIKTVAGMIRDRVVLQGIGGVAPSPAMEENLAALLRGLVAAPR